MGGANVIGDVGKGNYIMPFPQRVKGGDIDGYHINGSLGLLYRYNINPFMGFRLNLSLARVGASDHIADEQYKLDRDKQFGNRIYEGSLVYEYNFLDINDDQYFAHSPYMFFGIGLANYQVAKYGLKTEQRDGQEEINSLVSISKRENSFVLPFGVGYKVKFLYNWVLSAEVGFRYTGKDNLDFNKPDFTNELLDKANALKQEGNYKLQDEIDKRIHGNLSNKDWYVLSGLTLTYTFGRPACYCY